MQPLTDLVEEPNKDLIAEYNAKQIREIMAFQKQIENGESFTHVELIKSWIRNEKSFGQNVQH